MPDEPIKPDPEQPPPGLGRTGRRMWAVLIEDLDSWPHTRGTRWWQERGRVEDMTARCHLADLNYPEGDQ